MRGITTSEDNREQKQDDNFLARHKEYCEYLKRHTGCIGRSLLWSQLSGQFLTDLGEGDSLKDSIRKKAYFLNFVEDPGVNPWDRWMFRIVNKLTGFSFTKFINKFLGDRYYKILFEKLGYYEVKTKYYLKEHPLFGVKKCTHSLNLFHQWHSYCLLYPHLKDIKQMKYLEIGAGSGILSMLFHHDLGAKVVIVDLPEMISYSSACIHKVLPKARLLLPHEINDELNRDQYDFIFLLPHQADQISDDYFDLALNCMSLCEMEARDIESYFGLIQRAVKHRGLFFCSNRIRKHPAGGRIYDVHPPIRPEAEGTNCFFGYPWRRENKDLLIDINCYRYFAQFKNHLTIDRLQQIVKDQGAP